MNDDQLLRYSRHILLDEFGIEGQQRLSESHALIIGAGGLGSPAALYLGAAGIGKLTLVDPDTVDLTNLQRQILHVTANVGHQKVESARAALARLNPDVEIAALPIRAEGEQLEALVSSADVVLDCTDNFATRHAINRACVAHRVPLVSGAALRFDGQLTSFDLRQACSACYACLFPADASFEEQACSTMGVFGPVVGTIGTLQAAEAIRLLTGIGETLAGRLLIFEGLRTQWNEIRYRRQMDCPVCGARPLESS